MDFSSLTNTFGENRGLQVAYNSGSISTRTETPPRPSLLIPFRRDPDFVSHGTLLDQICRHCTIPGSRTALVGLGGVGKSQLAIEFAYQTHNQSPISWVFWVYASNAARFEQSYRDIANFLRLPERESPETNIPQLVHDWLRNETRTWILILDNVDDVGFLRETQDSKGLPLAAYIPQCQNGSVLITTRSRSAALQLVETRDIIVVEPMGPDDALALAEKKLAEKQDETGKLAELVNLLELMPLAIVQAAAYISNRRPRYSVQEYVRAIQKNDQKITRLLSHEGGQLRRDWDAKNSILVTWQLSFNYIHQIDPAAANLLSLMSFFDRQGIPESLLRIHSSDKAILENERKQENKTEDETLQSSESDDDEFEDSIETLRHFFLISINTDGKTFGMHRLVQLATRNWLEFHGQSEKWRHQFIKNLYAKTPSCKFEDWDAWRILFPHAKAAVAQQPETRIALIEWALVLNNASQYAYNIGNWTDAETMVIHAMRARQKTFGLDHQSALESMILLASIYSFTGKSKEAEELLLNALDRSERTLGQDHPTTLSSLSEVAVMYSSQRRWGDLKALISKRPEGSTREDDLDESGVRIYSSYMVQIYLHQREWDKAEELAVELLEAHKQLYGLAHPLTLMAMMDLASAYCNQGRLELAEELEGKVLETKKSILGLQHASTQNSMHNLARIWREQGRDEEALELMRECVRLRRCTLGTSHTRYLESSSLVAKWEGAQTTHLDDEYMLVQIGRMSMALLPGGVKILRC